MSRRERLHTEMKEEIKAIARQQMALEGNEALSLRAIARQMEVTAPALYRYFASRDELITALILDAFNGLGDALETADGAVQTEQGQAAYGPRLQRVLFAYRDWALTHPTDFALIYGTPIVGYVAPAPLTAAASERSIAVIIRVLTEAFAAGALTIPSEVQQIPPTVQSAIVALVVEHNYPTAVEPFYAGVIAWSRCHGLVMLELFGHITPVVGDTSALYEAEVTTLLARLGLSP
jgi:AcrR family transcriptional regulator